MTPVESASTPDVFDRRRLEVPAPDAAVALLGALLVREEPQGTTTVARVVETEAYREDDPASHSAAGRTARTAPMFERPGTAYVYRSYGLHWCLNVSVEDEGIGAAVLLRAAAVVSGIDRVRSRRPAARRDRDLLRGPGRLTAGLDVDGPRHDGSDLVLGTSGLRLADDGWRPEPGAVVAGGRVGVRHAPDRPWRYHVRDVDEVSSYRRHPAARPGGC